MRFFKFGMGFLGLRLVRILLLFVIPLVAVLWGLRIYAEGGRIEETENAYVKANIVAVSAGVPPGGPGRYAPLHKRPFTPPLPEGLQ